MMMMKPTYQFYTIIVRMTGFDNLGHMKVQKHYLQLPCT